MTSITPDQRIDSGDGWLSHLSLTRIAPMLLLLVVLMLATRVTSDTDVGWHLRSAQVTLESGMIYQDSLSHTFFGQPWVNHSWLSQLIYYSSYQVLGWAGLTLIQATLATAGMWLIYVSLKSHVYIRLALILVAAFMASIFWSQRPQMFTFLLSCLTIVYPGAQKRRASSAVVYATC